MEKVLYLSPLQFTTYVIFSRVTQGLYNFTF